ncbi:MAG TPA: hypothetical protein PK812_07380 [Beijerinckiaceae bacterium]|nr:hypothetical protein [Beijerinckiaceae bacterium]
MQNHPFFGRRALFGAVGLVAALLAAPVAAQDPASDPVAALTPAQAYARGCGSCHRSERGVVRAIPKRPDAERRAWIETFMADHPCEFDAGKAKILDYLVEKSRR